MNDDNPCILVSFAVLPMPLKSLHRPSAASDELCFRRAGIPTMHKLTQRQGWDQGTASKPTPTLEAPCESIFECLDHTNGFDQKISHTQSLSSCMMNLAQGPSNWLLFVWPGIAGYPRSTYYIFDQTRKNRPIHPPTVWGKIKAKKPKTDYSMGRLGLIETLPLQSKETC